jgi:hypothetical protein
LPSIRTVALACLIALAPVASAAAAYAPVTVTKTYVGNNDVLRVTAFDNVCMGGPHGFRILDRLGGVCYAPPAGATRVSLSIADQTGQPVGAYYSFTTTTGQYVTGHFCGATSATIPSDAYVLSVVIDGALQGPFDCNPHGQGAGIGTSGAVTAVFS